MGLLLGQVSKWRAQRADRGAHAARGFLGGATVDRIGGLLCQNCFNAARGFVGGAAHEFFYRHQKIGAVSMPHAALWVVQRN